MDLLCQISKGDKPIQIKWNFEGFTDNNLGLHTKTNRISSKSSMLMISSAKSYHTGKYTCTAKNAAGSVSYAINITVNGISINSFMYNTP